MKLVTTWFGTFILDDEGQIVENSLFPKDEKEIASRLELIDNNEVLAQEEELADGRELEVREKRLELLGTFSDFQQPGIRVQGEGAPGTDHKAGGPGSNSRLAPDLVSHFPHRGPGPKAHRVDIPHHGSSASHAVHDLFDLDAKVHILLRQPDEAGPQGGAAASFHRVYSFDIDASVG